MVKISLFTFCFFSSIAVTAFYFPVYLQYKELDNGEIGLVMGIGSFVAIFAQPFWGFVSDRTGTIKKVIACIMITSLLVSLIFFNATGLLWILLSMIMFMFFFNSIAPLTESMMISYAYRHGRPYGSIRLWGEIGVGTAALWIGLLLEQFGLHSLLWIFIIIVGSSLFPLILVPDARTQTVPVTKSSLIQLFTNKTFLTVLGMLTMISIPHRINDTFLPIYMKEIGGSEADIGYAWLIATMCAVPTMALIGKLLTRFKEISFIIFSGCFYSLRWFIYSYADEPWILLAGQSLHMLTFPVLLIAAVQLVYKIVPPELKVTGQTIFTAVFFGLGGIIGSMFGGWIMDHYETHQLYLVASILSFTGTALFFVFRHTLSQAPVPQVQTTMVGKDV